MSVILRYETGFPTRLVKQKGLVRLLERDGPPTRIEGGTLFWSGSAGRYAATWSHRLSGYPFFPGDKRKLVSVELEG